MKTFTTSSPVERSQFLFIYTSKYNNPNGDPFTGNPRHDEATDKSMVSDERIKRYIRDYWIAEGEEIYMREVDKKKLKECPAKEDSVDKKGKKETGSAAQIKLLGKKYGNLSARELMLKCLDVVTFGGVGTTKGDNVALTGPIQIANLNSSLNRVNLQTYQGTSVFQSSMEKSQGAISTAMLVPFGVHQITGEVNQTNAKVTGLTEEQVIYTMDSMWNSIISCVSKSKQKQSPRLLLKFNLTNPMGQLADLEEEIFITPIDESKDEYDLRSIKEIAFDFSNILRLIASDKVKSVQYRIDSSIENAFLSQMDSVKDKLIQF
jgi:CRISPR-associated protein Csh2